MDMVLLLIILLVLFGGGGGLYWGMGAGWGIGPIGLIIAVLVVAFLLNGRRGDSKSGRPVSRSPHSHDSEARPNTPKDWRGSVHISSMYHPALSTSAENVRTSYLREVSV